MENSNFWNDNYTALCSEKTLQSDKNGFFLNFAEHVLEKAGSDWLQQTFAKLKTDRERIEILFNDNQIKDAVKDTLSNVRCIYRKKDAEFSNKKRLEGETLMKQGSAKKALMLFCQSVLRAPHKDNKNTLSLALYQRSQCLIELGHLNQAILDLQLAQKYNPPDNLRAEIFADLAQCYHVLGESKKSKVCAELAKKLGKSKILINVLKRIKENPEPVLPKIQNGDGVKSNLLKLRETKEMGRYMVANENIKTGETLIVEKPFVACLISECFGSHCHHCFKSLLAPVGCPDCCSLAFCSVDCQQVALSTYHKYECHILDLLIGSGMSVLCHAALRTITQGNDNFDPINQLCSHSEKRDPTDLLRRTLMAAFLLQCLIAAGYFGKIDETKLCDYTNEMLQVGERLLTNLQILQFNAHEIYETRRTREHKFKSTKTAYIGIALYPNTSLLNHDCYPAVTRYFVGQNIIIKSTRPIAKGDMIAENYGPIFLKKTLADRQRSLASRYWFKCQCHACIQDWPLLDKLENLHGRLKCPNENCNNLFVQPVKEKTKCLACNRKVNMKTALDELRKVEEMYKNGLDEMMNQNPEKATEIICEAIDRFHKIASAPHKDTHLCQIALQTCAADSGNVVIVN